jgi:hypothetical protein
MLTVPALLMRERTQAKSRKASMRFCPVLVEVVGGNLLSFSWSLAFSLRQRLAGLRVFLTIEDRIVRRS